MLGSDFQPDVLIDAESIAADGVGMPGRAAGEVRFRQRARSLPCWATRGRNAAILATTKFAAVSQPAPAASNDAIFPLPEPKALPSRHARLACGRARVRDARAGTAMARTGCHSPPEELPSSGRSSIKKEGVHWPDSNRPAFGALMGESAHPRPR